MDTGSRTRNLVVIFLGILVAYGIARTLSDAVTDLLLLSGATGTIAGMILFALIFFAILRLLEKYGHIAFFGFSEK